MARELYVGHLSESVTEEDVRKLFSVMGTVTSVHLIINPDTGEFKRCGYVRMTSGVDLNEVVETLDGAYLVDREIVVSIARPQKPGMSKSGGNKQPWMKSGSRSGAKPAARAKPKPKSDAVPEQRSQAGAATAGRKPDDRTETRPFNGKRPAAPGGSRPFRQK